MRVAVLNLTGGGTSGGHRKYLANMLPRLAASDKISAILCASPASLGVKKWLPVVSRLEFAECEPFRPFLHHPGKTLKAALDAFKPDLLFIPLERYIEYNGLPTVVMLQNMAPLTRSKTGNGFKEMLVAIVRRYETRYALKRASAVIVPTEYVRKFLIDNKIADDRKISVIRFGYLPQAVSASPPGSFPFGASEFLFTAGSVEIYKGIEDLIRALSVVKEKRPGIRLVVAGVARPTAAGYLSRLKKLAALLGVAEDIFWPGNLSEGELAWYYSACSVFVLTSRVESFCFVALEAMGGGCRIVSTDSPCLPEVLGDAALYYKAGDAVALASRISAVLDGEAPGLSSAATRRAETFSWDKTAAATLELFPNAKSL